MKRAIVAGIAIFLLAGCTPEVKESKQESKTATHKTESIQKIQSEEAYEPLTVDEQVYMETIGKFIGNYSNLAGNIQMLMKQANADPSIAKTDDWMNALKGDFKGIDVMNRLLAEMPKEGAVPERFESLHKNLSECFGLMVMAGDLLVKSIEQNLDPTLFNDSMQTMAESNQKMVEVNEELDKIKSEVKGN